MTRWLDPQPINVPASFSTLNLPPLIEQILLRRGINSPEMLEAFFPSNTSLSVEFPNIKTAISVILLAIRNKEKICIWGDFDVDGQTSTALLVETLRALDANVVYYIPIRGKESHGIHIETLKPIIDSGVTLIITCDTGITAHEAVDYANSRGASVVITDHHDLSETLPNAKAIINPKLLPDQHPLKNLAGVGVAYKLAEALLSSQTDSRAINLQPDDLLDLVALGLVADVALLKGETRSLVQKGIQKLRETKRMGLKAIAELSGTNLETLTEETIGFTFAPRLNALGRLSDANPAVELLITQDSARARVLAAQIEGLNAQRRLLTSQIYEAAETQLRDNPSLLTEPIIILSHPNWPGGVVGIVANRLVNRYHKPVLLLTESEDGILRGSARSVDGLHITEAIATQKNIIHNFGGHPMAAGLSLPQENLSAFRKGIGKAIEAQAGAAANAEPTLQIEGWLNLAEISPELVISLEMLSPFGSGNPIPILATRNVILRSVTLLGKAKEHRRLNIEDENGNSQSILWWNSAAEELPATESKMDIAYSLRAGTFRKQKQITLQFEEFRLLEEAPIEVRDTEIKIHDLRLQVGTFERFNVKALVWAEGADKEKGKSRYNLYQADEFAIYTTPPSPAELRTVLKIVKPKTIYVFAVSPEEDTPESFLNKLAGLCKYAINKRNGKTDLQELTSAMASPESAVQIGLEWLAAGGYLTVNIDNHDQIILSSIEDGSLNSKNIYLQSELFVALRGLLNETTAFRKYFATVDMENMMSI